MVDSGPCLLQAQANPAEAGPKQGHTLMRAEALQLVEEIKQSVGLLRRHL